MELGSEGGEGEDLEERKRDLIKMHHYVYVELSSNKELISLLRRPEICNPRTVGMAVFADSEGESGSCISLSFLLLLVTPSAPEPDDASLRSLLPCFYHISLSLIKRRCTIHLDWPTARMVTFILSAMIPFSKHSHDHSNQLNTCLGIIILTQYSWYMSNHMHTIPQTFSANVPIAPSPTLRQFSIPVLPS
jgi:hypothetical protein